MMRADARLHKKMPKAYSSETHAYAEIKRELKRRGFSTRNPNRDPHGEVYTQHEAAGNEELKKALQGGVPECVVKLGADKLWVIEAKRHPNQLTKAFNEAKDYAKTINANSSQFESIMVTGVAGSDEDGYKFTSAYLAHDGWKKITIEGSPLSRLLSKSECIAILTTKDPNIHQRELTTKEVVDLSKKINKRLHKAKVAKERRAPTVAALLLALSKSPHLRFNENDQSDVFVNDINSRAEQVFKGAGKMHLWEQVKLVPPSEDNASYATALNDVITLLREAEILSSTHQTDILGPFFENFLKYGNTAKDIGIVLTPRHICRLVANVVNSRSEHILYDPAVGTGGFLIAAYNHVRENETPAAAKRFAKDKIYGCEDNGPVASLAFINMYFRGDGKHNLQNSSCFNTRLVASSHGAKALKFKDGAAFNKKELRGVSHVMMNPPFALKNTDEAEYKFVDHALTQMQPNGLLFSVLPSSVMYSAETAEWRKQLLEANQILSVVLFPNDLFYPVAVESVGVFIRKGVPHGTSDVLWVRLDDDGYTKWKGFRVPKHDLKSVDRLQSLAEVARAWVCGGIKSPVEPGFFEFHPIRVDELIPQAHMGTPPLDLEQFEHEAGRAIRDFIYTLWSRPRSLQQ
ncbi:MAG: SAM-dependent methyltransferase [Acidobacteriales bacterium]|nr:SAM-dependent methyltransferase [Terriglobales bacterium]